MEEKYILEVLDTILYIRKYNFLYVMSKNYFSYAFQLLAVVFYNYLLVILSVCIHTIIPFIILLLISNKKTLKSNFFASQNFS